MPMETLEELFVEEIRDLYDAEKQLVKALPKMAKGANSDELRAALEEHLEQTKEQVTRLEQVFETLEEKAKGKPCKAMKGLIAEGQEVMQEQAAENMTDLALIAAAQKVEHYEISGYGSAPALAQTLGNDQAVQLLEETLEEEKEADKKLTEISMQIMGNSNEPGGEEDEEEEVEA